MTTAEALEGSGLPSASIVYLQALVEKLTDERKAKLAIALGAEPFEYALGALRSIAASGKDSTPQQLAAMAQVGIDLVTLGLDGCAEMRGDADARNDRQKEGRDHE